MCRVPKSNRSGSRFGEETEGTISARTGRGCFSVAFLTSADTSEAATVTTAVGEEAGAAEVATVTTVVGEAGAVGIVRREGRVAQVGKSAAPLARYVLLAGACVAREKACVPWEAYPKRAVQATAPTGCASHDQTRRSCGGI
jgi:hypothetical protein